MSTLADAKATLLRALEQIEQAEGDLENPPTAAFLNVTYSIGVSTEDNGAWHEVGGWVNTGDPLWLHAAMLRRCADALDDQAREPDEDDE